MYYSARELSEVGLSVSPTVDYYSPLPVLLDLEKNKQRWSKPSSLNGVKYDLSAMKLLLKGLLSQFEMEYGQIPSYEENANRGFGPGYTPLDSLTLYMMVRDFKPSRYIEVGSGLSTFYSSLAAKRNNEQGKPLRITCIEPFPYPMLSTIQNIEVIKREVQDVALSEFSILETGDILFIDSSHSVKVDGDVPYLFLEVLPRLKPGVLVHIHDIPFPYNIPYPPDLWVFNRQWPMYWTEAMLVQAFLAFNDTFEIILSTPLLRHYEEAFLRSHIPNYASVDIEPNTFSSLWLRKTA